MRNNVVSLKQLGRVIPVYAEFRSRLLSTLCMDVGLNVTALVTSCAGMQVSQKLFS
jgi:hypothetical protein